ncbi:MAG: AIPR family protein [Planctomycetota bacterium]
MTLLCESIKKKPVGGAQREYGEFECAGASVVNGAQTVGQIGSAFAQPDDVPEDAQVLVRIISLENVPEGFGQRITRATNTQNRVEGRDFASLDENQRRVHRELALDGIEYAYRSGDAVHDPSSGFSLTEATVALACAQG